MTRYEHTQAGYVTAGTSAAAVVAIGAILLLSDEEATWITAATLGIIAGAGVLFSSLTVNIEEEVLRFYFGPGFWKKEVPLAEIESHRVVRNAPLYGWGIRYTPQGWLYNVSGLSAVELVLRDGTTLRVGTDEPQRLDRVLSQAKTAG